jgi:5-formyltetrahydrofolate cyclo-ligase
MAFPDASLPDYLDAQKKALRSVLSTRRRAAWLAEPDAGLGLRDQFLRAFTLPPGCVVAAYAARGDEIDPLPLALELGVKGHVLGLPVVVTGETPLLFRRWDQTASLQRGTFGIFEPPSDAGEVEPDVLLVPLLGFDHFGNRIGYGKGYYDRTLRQLQTRKKIIAVGLAYAAQEEPSLPVTQGDFRLDAVVTERGVR